MSKILPPQELIADRKKRISSFLETGINGKTIYGWQLIIRMAGDAAIADSMYAGKTRNIVLRYSCPDDCVLDPENIALKSVINQLRFNINGYNVDFDCNIIQYRSCATDALALNLREALQKSGVNASNIESITDILFDKRNITYIGDLLCFAPHEIESLSGIGKKRMKTIDKMLRQYDATMGVFRYPSLVHKGNVLLEFQVIVN